MSVIHTVPVNDLIEHDTGDGSCICGPQTTPVFDDEGSVVGWQVIHNSLDGREFTEPDYEGPPMPKEP